MTMLHTRYYDVDETTFCKAIATSLDRHQSLLSCDLLGRGMCVFKPNTIEIELEIEIEI